MRVSTIRCLPDFVQKFVTILENGKTTLTDAELVERTGLSLRSVQKCIRYLRENGAIETKTTRDKMGAGWVNIRTITLLGGLKNGNDVSQS